MRNRVKVDDNIFLQITYYSENLLIQWVRNDDRKEIVTEFGNLSDLPEFKNPKLDSETVNRVKQIGSVKRSLWKTDDRGNIYWVKIPVTADELDFLFSLPKADPGEYPTVFF